MKDDRIYDLSPVNTPGENKSLKKKIINPWLGLNITLYLGTNENKRSYICFCILYMQKKKGS